MSFEVGDLILFRTKYVGFVVDAKGIEPALGCVRAILWERSEGQGWTQPYDISMTGVFVIGNLADLGVELP